MVYFQSSLYVSADITTAFRMFKDEIQISFLKKGLQIDFTLNGEIQNGSKILGTIKELQENSLIVIEWSSLNPLKQDNLILEIKFEKHNNGTVVIFEPKQIEHFLGDQESELLGWYVEEVLTKIFYSLIPSKFGDWVTDRNTRKPSGPNARKIYSDPLYHWPNFYQLLETMELTSNDILLEVGCGGGVLLREALKSGCKAKAIDHSPEMVKLAIENNKQAIEKRLLEVVLSEAESLPFNNDYFTCAVMTGVFQFFSDPDIVLKEIFRVLKKSGRLYIYGGSKEMKGTVAAPEPYASRLKFYDKDELEKLAKKVGFAKAQVIQPDLRENAKKTGVPADDLWLFESKYGLFLIATK